MRVHKNPKLRNFRLRFFFYFISRQQFHLNQAGAHSYAIVTLNDNWFELNQVGFGRLHYFIPDHQSNRGDLDAFI